MSTEISLFVRGKQIQHAEERAVRSIECNVRVTIWVLVPLALGIELGVGDLTLKRAISYALGFAGDLFVPLLVKILPGDLHTFARPQPTSVRIFPQKRLLSEQRVPASDVSQGAN